MPLATATFNDIITFSRTSSAWYYNSSGVLTQAATNTPRFDYDPITLAPQGLLIEGQRTNLVLRNSEFSTASWTTTNTTVTADSTTSPDGAVTADTLVENTATATHSTSQTLSFVSGTAYAYSLFVKEPPTNINKRYISIYFQSTAFGANLAVVVDAATGQITAASAGLATTITSVGNGWYRVTISATATVTTNALVTARLSNVSTSGLTSYTGDGVSGMYLWGAQVEVGNFSTSYIPTAATTVTRAADVADINTLLPWYNSTEGTVVAQFKAVNATSSEQQTIWALNSSSLSNLIYAARTASTNCLRYYVQNSGVAQADSTITSPTIANGAVAKAAVGMATNNYNAALNGTLGTQSTSVTMPTVVQMNLGSSLSTNFLAGYLQQLTYYPKRLADEELRAFTA